MGSAESDLGLSDYLLKKKIFEKALKENLPEVWEKFYRTFPQEGAASFDARNKFLINNLRLQFPLPPSAQEESRDN